MTRAQAKKVLAGMKLKVHADTIHGITIMRYTIDLGRFAYRHAWRLYPASGIAGNAGVWWMRPHSFPDSVPERHEEPRGPYPTMRALRHGLTIWRNQQPVWK